MTSKFVGVAFVSFRFVSGDYKQWTWPRTRGPRFLRAVLYSSSYSHRKLMTEWPDKVVTLFLHASMWLIGSLFMEGCIQTTGIYSVYIVCRILES